MAYDFRNIYPNLLMGTASDRYAGWIGQIYTQDYSEDTKKRQKRVTEESFEETVLPIRSVKEYFEHFQVLELDYTFYGLLLDERGKHTNVYKTLASYMKYVSDEDKLVLKVPQIITAKKIWKSDGFVTNEFHLNQEIFVTRFLEPCYALLGPHLFGLIFEQEYHTKKERDDNKKVLASWQGFFEAVPDFHGYHLELRTPSYITPSLMEMLKQKGVGIVLSHWTWLPPLRVQYNNLGEATTNKARVQVIRLMTPRNVRYEDAYKKAYPFDSIKEELFDQRMVEDTVSLIRKITQDNSICCVIINNRAGGNAPMIAQMIKERLVH